MKLDRLLETTIILLNKGTVTAKELAERFSVSTRTIYRDIDILSAAGVPVYAGRGNGGGISLLDKYALPKTIVSKEESDSIMFSLKALQVTKYPEIDKVIEKLNALFQSASTEWIHIDFSSWGSNPNQYNRLANIKMAILQCRVIEFDYVSSSNIRSHRTLEPLKLIFKSQAWYLWGWSVERNAYRMFRISRIKSISVLDILFERNKTRISVNTDDTKPVYEKIVSLELKFTEEALFRLYDNYDDDMIQKNDDGTYTVKTDFPEDEWVYSYILGFGEHVDVIDPPHIRQIIKEKAKKIYSKYI